jgi:hypothetical protein
LIALVFPTEVLNGPAQLRDKRHSYFSSSETSSN